MQIRILSATKAKGIQKNTLPYASGAAGEKSAGLINCTGSLNSPLCSPIHSRSACARDYSDVRRSKVSTFTAGHDLKEMPVNVVNATDAFMGSAARIR
jgi:hypothetical protein